MELEILFFWIIAFMFIGYFVLDGFDFSSTRLGRSGTSTRRG
jgi:cytochrome d ubiquinol oxidase subunit II